MRIARIATVGLVASAALVAGMPGQAQAAGAVRITKIYYDSPGTDLRSNASLNAEYVQIRNGTTKAVSLKGWTLTDASRHKYTFGTFTLGAGKTVTVHTGKGRNNATHVYQQRAAYVWNNDRDTATLRRTNGAVQHACSYNSTRYDYKNC